MKRARFIAAARLEFLAEVIYHNEAQPGLGERFTAAVEEAAARALAFPQSGSPTRANTRRVIVKGFRFSLVYRPEPEASSYSPSRIIPDAPSTGALVLVLANSRWCRRAASIGPYLTVVPARGTPKR